MYGEEYVKSCPKCQRYKATNLKAAGLLQTPAPTQRFETIAVDLVGPLPEAIQGYRWIFIIEDVASIWVEIFPMIEATATACARILIDEIFLRYGTARRVVRDNGVQFILRHFVENDTFIPAITPHLKKFSATLQ